MDPALPPKTRADFLDEREIYLARISVSPQVLLQVTRHAASEETERGCGKLLGFFDAERETLFIEKSYPLLLPKQDEKIKKEDNIDELLNKRINEFSYNYRQVGFYIFCEDDDIFTHNILSNLVNNEKFGSLSCFLHFAVLNAKTDKNPFTFYQVSSEANQALFEQTTESDKNLFEAQEEKIMELSPKKNSIFSSVPFEISKGPVFQSIFTKCEEKLVGLIEEKEKGGEGKMSLLTKNLNEAINRQAFLVHSHVQNKRAQKGNTAVNLFGGYLRVQNLLKARKEILEEVAIEVEQIGKLV